MAALLIRPVSELVLPARSGAACALAAVLRLADPTPFTPRRVRRPPLLILKFWHRIAVYKPHLNSAPSSHSRTNPMTASSASDQLPEPTRIEPEAVRPAAATTDGLQAAPAATAAAPVPPEQPWGGASLQQLRTALQHFAAERDWGQYHTPRNLLLALVRFDALNGIHKSCCRGPCLRSMVKVACFFPVTPTPPTHPPCSFTLPHAGGRGR